MVLQEVRGDTRTRTVNECLRDSLIMASSVHAKCGAQDKETSTPPIDVDVTIEACDNSPTRCISDDRRTNEVIAELGLVEQKDSPSFPPSFGLCNTPQAVKGPVDLETAPGLCLLGQHIIKSYNNHLTQTTNCNEDKILVEASEAYRIKAPSRMVSSNPKKRCMKNFKWSGSKYKSRLGKGGHSVKESQVENCVEDNEVNDEAEDKKAWEIAKQLGLSAKDEDAVFQALANEFDHEKSKPMKRKRKKRKGKERKD